MTQIMTQNNLFRQKLRILVSVKLFTFWYSGSDNFMLALKKSYLLFGGIGAQRRAAQR
jgi:hypothetical protein